MGRKRKATAAQGANERFTKTKYDVDERFDDSEDEFYAGKEKILLEEEPAAKRRRRIAEQEKNLQLSDEEVLGNAEIATDESDEDFDDAQSAEENFEGSENEDETWGTSKADYYNADTIETEADAIDEEKEARRLQQKQLKSIANADFGFDETTWTDVKPIKSSSGPIVEKLPEATISVGASKAQLVDILYARYPEFQLLAKDLVDLQRVWQDLQHDTVASSASNPNSTFTNTKLNALSSYLGAIAMYFAVITSEIDTTGDVSKITAYPPSDLRDHTVIDNLITSKQTWDVVRGINVASIVESTPVAVDSTVGSKVEKKAVAKSKTPKKQKKVKGLSPDFDEMDSIDDQPEMPKKAQKSKSKILDLQALLDQAATSQTKEDSDFGDEGPLTEQQAAEKAKKKKSLRFYTSQIAQKANKRGAASREAGGDDDVPRKERLRDKQERLLKDAERRGQEKANIDEQLGGDSEDDVKQAGDADDYYQSLVRGSKQKKADKQAKADAYAEARKQGAQVYEEEQVGADGKRRITYAIEKNKGLAPKRNKDVRNPRVKKRKKYDEKMKKLSSIRQVYKGGEGRGGYAGELTGIKTNVVKSVKL